MEIVHTVERLGERLGARVGSCGFVPTMGALHQGHISLVECARAHNDTVVVSIFVNPTQFNDKGDLDRYPRTLQLDAQLLENKGVDFLFAPSVDEIYPSEESFTITDESLLSLASLMEGEHRKGHFDGVVQVVGRLLDIVCPDRAYFGQKDYQQAAIIGRMIDIERRGVQIVTCPIVRASDGLALSSRNALLGAEQRRAAPDIFRILSEVRCQISEGCRDYKKLCEDAILQINKNPYLCAQYVRIVDALRLNDAESTNDNVRVCAAVMCGDVRLIDNV